LNELLRPMTSLRKLADSYQDCYQRQKSTGYRKIQYKIQ
jgi:hypothetical protein